MVIIDSALIMKGLNLSLIGIVVVFAALVFLWFSLSLVTRFMSFKWKATSKNDEKHSVKDVADLTGETSAAIALALHMYLEDIHDQENTILTIKRYSKTYSPWSSKIYSVMGLNRRFHKKAS